MRFIGVDHIRNLCIDGRRGRCLERRWVRTTGTGTAGRAEDDQTRERVASETVGAVHSPTDFAGSKKTGYRTLARFWVRFYAAHDVMHCGPDFHGRAGNVYVG